MKNIFLAILIFGGVASAHEFEYRDKYGKIQGYADTDSNGDLIIKDKYGAKKFTVKGDGEIADTFNTRTGEWGKRDD